MSDIRPSNSTASTRQEAALSVAYGAMDQAMALQSLAAIAVAPQQAGGVAYAIVPKDFRLEDLTERIERQMPAPSRKRATIVVHDLASLMQYASDQNCTTAGYIYADAPKNRLVAVFNDDGGASPGWRDHRCEYVAAYTPEFERWKANDRKQMAQQAFAEFIEDNMADLNGAESRKLLDVALTLAAKTAIQFRSSRRLDNGEFQLNYHEAIEATAGQDGALSIPRTFSLGLRIFRNGDGYVLDARLKYRMRDGAVQFWYELDRVERAIEEAFSGYVQQVREKSGYRVLLGAP